MYSAKGLQCPTSEMPKSFHMKSAVSLNFLSAVRQNQCSLGSEVFWGWVFSVVWLWFFPFFFSVLQFWFGLFSHYITLYFAVQRKAFHWPWQSLAYVKMWTVLALDSVRNAEAHMLAQAITGFSPRELELIPSERNSCLCAAFPTAQKTKYTKWLYRGNKTNSSGDSCWF